MYGLDSDFHRALAMSLATAGQPVTPVLAVSDNVCADLDDLESDLLLLMEAAGGKLNRENVLEILRTDCGGDWCSAMQACALAR
jgi:hypothetical protein